MYTDKTSVRPQIPPAQHQICPKLSEITLSMMYDTQSQQRTHSGSAKRFFREFSKNKKVPGVEIEPAISQKSHYGPDSVEG